MLTFFYCYLFCFLSFFLFFFDLFFFCFPFFFFSYLFACFHFYFFISFFPFLFPTFLTFLILSISAFCKWCTVFGQAGNRQSVVETLEGSPACWYGCGSTGSGNEWRAGGWSSHHCSGGEPGCRWAACLKSPSTAWSELYSHVLVGIMIFIDRDHDSDLEGRLEQCRSSFPYPQTYL